ncbi:MAG: ATP-binding cassette domain-containing protein [Spirochaetaceae bacterium]|jgi:ABC-type lipoprotein export system ATPase subunit|nr:ATP-binding cassette domain-containing protein [Spirochaetaceae bacterium]
MGDQLLELRNAGFSAGKKTILTDISFHIETGDSTAILGPAGGGKTTALKLLAGLLVPSQGDAFFEGRALSSMNRQEMLAFRKRSAFVFQDSALWVNQSIYNTLELPLLTHFPAMSGKEREARVREAAELVRFSQSLAVRPADLSAGEQKKAGFARAIVCNPDILFLDECTESLDNPAKEIFHGILSEFHTKGGTMVFVSHDRRFIDLFAQKVIHIEAGQRSDNR